MTFKNTKIKLKIKSNNLVRKLILVNKILMIIMKFKAIPIVIKKRLNLFQE